MKIQVYLCRRVLDWIGLDWIGLDWIGLDWIGLDWIVTKTTLYEISDEFINKDDLTPRYHLDWLEVNQSSEIYFCISFEKSSFDLEIFLAM